MTSHVPDEGRKSTRQEARARTRRRLLDAGADLLTQQPLSRVTAQVRANDVVAFAGMSVGAFYGIWDSQDEYLEDLLDFVFREERIKESVPPVIPLIQEAAAGGTPFEDLVAFGADIFMDFLANDPYHVLQMGLWANARAEESLRERLSDLYGHTTAQFEELYSEMLNAYGRRLRPGYELSHLTAALSAVTDGLTIRRAIDPHAIPQEIGPQGGTRSLPALVCYAVIDAMTEPDPGLTPPPGTI